MQAAESTATFDSIFEHLTSTYGFPLLHVSSPYPHNPSYAHHIAELSLHPTLESILHILNSDLPGAHFLCRHMQNQPAWEGMYIHGLLHRVEGDYENAKLWYEQVQHSDCFKHVWTTAPGLDAAWEFVDDVKALRDGLSDAARSEILREESRREITLLTEWCTRKFGTGRLRDATEAWVEPSEEHRAMAAKMIVGGEGWRQF